MKHIETTIDLTTMSRNTELSYEERRRIRKEWLQRDCNKANSEQGQLEGYDCLECLNRGFIHTIHEGSIVVRECQCSAIRADMRRISDSGLSGLLNSCTFDSFQTPDRWHQHMKSLALRFVDDATDGKWFYAGGQIGSGKTHLCTAIVGKFLHSGKAARYMLWRDYAVQIKASVNDAAEYSGLINPLKFVDVLYIDDLFKTGTGKAPTPADVNIAFEILNHRYINRQLITILSSEWGINDLLDIDEAVGSRIFERTREFCLYVERDKSRNWRLRK